MNELTETTTAATDGQSNERAESTTAATAAPAGPPDGWREMKVAQLAELCKAEGLATSGKRADLVKRLELHFYGSSEHHVHGRVVCPYCRAAARCIGVRWMSDTIRRRSYRCRGRRRHSFTLDSQATGPERKEQGK